MWYAIGAHPGFNCPMEEGFAFEDYQLVFEKEENTVSIPYDLDQLHFPLQTGNQAEGLHLSLKREMFRNDAVFFDKLNSRAVSISILPPATAWRWGFPALKPLLSDLYPEPAPYLLRRALNGSGIYENEDDQPPIGTTYSISVQGTAAAIS